MNKTLSRLASARNYAEQAGLESTAQRIEILRKELSNFHSLSMPMRVSRICWARAKVDETKASMAKELERPQEIKDRQAGKEIHAIVAKILLCLNSMCLAIPILYDSDHKFLGGFAFITGTVAIAGVIDHLIGPKNIKYAIEDISAMLDQIKSGLTLHFE